MKKALLLAAVVGTAVVLGVAWSCGSPTSACGPGTCSGCCSASGSCFAGTSTAACGSGGQVCSPCSGSQTCTQNVCTGSPGNDAGPTPDAGPGPDAGPAHDAGPTPDSGIPADAGPATDAGPIHTVFLIMMENENWAAIQGSAAAPYINGTLLTQGGHAQSYYGPVNGTTTIHPSEPNYLWLEAGTNFTITTDATPATHHQATTAHLVTQLEAASVTWTSWQEDISGTDCPISSVTEYVPRHNPMVYFDDVTNTNSTTSARCIQHVRPYTELAAALTNGTAARYNFITPNLCHDMHGDSTLGGPNNCPGNLITLGDTWLSQEVPKILASSQYRNGGVLFILWDESEAGLSPTCALSLNPNCNIGFMVMSPKLKSAGYSNTIAYSHSSTLRTLQEIFGVSPFLGDAANATDLRDFFTSFP